MGAAATLEAIACLLAARHGVIPHTFGLEELDPECALDVVAGAPRVAPVRVSLSTSLGFGGCNAALVLEGGSRVNVGVPHGVVTGWGRGLAALPADARAAADGRRVIEATPIRRTGDRLRRATRECLLAHRRRGRAARGPARWRARTIAGDGTALVYVTAAAYGASNRAFVEGGGARCTSRTRRRARCPAEVAIEFGLHGPYAVFIGGAGDHHRRARPRGRTLLRAWRVRAARSCWPWRRSPSARISTRAAAGSPDRPLVEAAAAVLLEPAARAVRHAPRARRARSPPCPPPTP